MENSVSRSIRRAMRLWCFVPLCAVLVFGCQEVEVVKPVFDKTASERVQERANELRELLKSSEYGWEVDYQPATGEVGFFNFIFEFVSDTTVTTLSDFSEEFVNNISISEYAIIQGSTTKLSFNTGGVIHRLSDAAHSPIPGAGGAGLKGDFEFLYYGTNEEGNIIFRTNRRQDTLIFRKAIFESRSDLRRSFRSGERLEFSTSLFRSLSYFNSDTVFKSDLEFSTTRRTVTIREVLKDQDSLFYGPSYTSAINFTPKGVRIDSIVSLGGGEDVLKKVELEYDARSGTFVARLDEGVTVSLGGTRVPLIPITDHKLFLDKRITNNLLFLHNDPFTNFTSKSFNDLFSNLRAVNPVRITGALRLTRQLRVGARNEIDILLLHGTPSVRGNLVAEFLIYEDKGTHLKISRAGNGGAASFFNADTRIDPLFSSEYGRLVDALVDPAGFYVENLGQRTAFPNHVYRFISRGDPSIRIAFYHVPRG